MVCCAELRELCAASRGELAFVREGRFPRFKKMSPTTYDKRTNRVIRSVQFLLKVGVRYENIQGDGVLEASAPVFPAHDNHDGDLLQVQDLRTESLFFSSEYVHNIYRMTTRISTTRDSQCYYRFRCENMERGAAFYGG